MSSKKIKFHAKIPFDKMMVEAMVHGKSIIEFKSESDLSSLPAQIWNELANLIH